MSMLKSTPPPVVTVVAYIPGVHVCSSSWSPQLLLMARRQFSLTITLRVWGFPLHHQSALKKWNRKYLWKALWKTFHIYTKIMDYRLKLSYHSLIYFMSIIFLIVIHWAKGHNTPTPSGSLRFDSAMMAYGSDRSEEYFPNFMVVYAGLFEFAPSRPQI